MSFLRAAVRLIAPGIVTAVGAGVILVPKTVLLEKAKDETQCYSNGFPVPVSPHVHNLLLEVKSDLVSAANLQSCNITAEKLNCIKPYTVFGYDMYRLGWIETSYGGKIGVPDYFKNDRNELRTQGILVNNASVQWSSSAGQQLKKSLIISDEAKKFAIAREILHFFQSEVEVRTLNNMGCILVPWTLALSLRRRLNLQARPKLIGYTVYAMVVVFAASLWVMIQDGQTLKQERAVDSALCALGPSYRRGGLEYYSSLQQRNLALRDLLGESGPKVFTARGNEKTLIRTKHLPVVERTEFFRKQQTPEEEATHGTQAAS